ncbi:Ig-like domain-containing protein [Streptomyces chiangmaiensis]
MPDIQIDASQLTIPYFTIPEGGTEVLDGSTSPPPRVSLPARTGYHLQPLNLAARFEFEVKADGTVDFDPAFDEFLNGRGTGTLVLCGYAISIDGTALSHDLLLTAEGKTWWPRGQTHQLTLMPAANYGFQSGSGIVGNWLFDVKPDGNVDYNPEFDEFLDGRGSSRLTVLGRLVDVDGIALSHDLIPMNLAGNAGPLPRSQVHRLTLMPAANYGFQPGSGIVGNWLFDVKPDGKVDYKPEFDQFLNGRDTQTLVLRGYAVSIDATHADSDLVGIANLEVSAQSPRGLSAVLLPAKGYLPRTANGIFATAFNLEPDGTISFSPSAAGRYVFKLSTSPNPSKLGEKVTLTASVHPVPPRQGTPQGSLTFKEGPTVLGYAELDQNGQATFQTSALSSGLHEIVIEYPGDQRFQPSSAELRHRVDPTGEPITDALPESPLQPSRLPCWWQHASQETQSWSSAPPVCIACMIRRRGQRSKRSSRHYWLLGFPCRCTEPTDGSVRRPVTPSVSSKPPTVSHPQIPWSEKERC